MTRGFVPNASYMLTHVIIHTKNIKQIYYCPHFGDEELSKFKIQSSKVVEVCVIL